MRANEPRHERLDEKYLMSLVIDLSARTVKPEGHPSVPIKGSVDDEDVVAFASPKVRPDLRMKVSLFSQPAKFAGRCHSRCQMETYSSNLGPEVQLTLLNSLVGPGDFEPIRAVKSLALRCDN